MSFIEVRNVGVRYGAAPILDDISIGIEEGAFVTLVGASGCGKSTFLRLLLSQDRPTTGTIRIAGEPIPARPTPDRGIVFQRYSVFPHLTLTENLILPLEFERAPFLGRLYGARRKALCAEIEEILDRIGLREARERYPAQLSGGMQQRLAIAQALLKKPRLLLLDEPFGALDPGIRRDMHELIHGLWRELGMTVVMVTHDIAEAFKLGTRLIVFDRVRQDPAVPNRYGATITYDLPLRRPNAPRGGIAAASVQAAEALDRTVAALTNDASSKGEAT